MHHKSSGLLVCHNCNIRNLNAFWLIGHVQHDIRHIADDLGIICRGRGGGAGVGQGVHRAAGEQQADQDGGGGEGAGALRRVGAGAVEETAWSGAGALGDSDEERAATVSRIV